MRNIKFDDFWTLSKRQQKYIIRHDVMNNGISRETAVMTQRCAMRRNYGNGGRASEWYCDKVPVAHMEENRVYRKYYR